MNSRKQKFNAIIVSIVIIVFAAQMAGIGLLLPKKAQAMAAVVEEPVLETAAGIEFTERKTEKAEKGVREILYKGLVLTAATTFRNAMVYMARQAAERTVTWVSTGNWGEGPMFYEQAWTSFSENLIDGFITQMIDNLSAYLGVDICMPPNVELSIKLIIIGESGKGEKPSDDRCKLEDLARNWSDFAAVMHEKFKATAREARDYSLLMLDAAQEMHFTIYATDIGKTLLARRRFYQKLGTKVEGAKEQRREDQGIFSVQTINKEKIKTPSSTVKAHTESQFEKATATPEKEMEASANVMEEIPEQMGSAFLNTFISKAFTELIVKKLLKGLIPGVNVTSGGQISIGVYNLKESLEKQFSSQKINYSFSSKKVDLVSEFETCTSARGINNCVMDSGFAEAVRRATQDKPMSVREAMDEGALKANFIFIGPDDERNSHDDCYEIGYCYSNLVKLRKARIIPIGWEIAAQKVKKGEIVTLQNIVDKFNITADAFYHLIDQNWILRYPEAQCKAMVSGPLLVAAGAAERADYCADLQTCIYEDEDKGCQAWGYCAAEKNIFRFGGESCPGQYDSCRSFTAREGKEVNYLYNTVDKSGCDSANVGCKWFSDGKINTNQIVEKWDSNSKIYLNKNIEEKECSPQDEGCSRFIRTEAGIGTNLIPNSGFDGSQFKDVMADQLDDDGNGYKKNTSIINIGVAEFKNAFDGSQEIIIIGPNKAALQGWQIFDADGQLPAESDVDGFAMNQTTINFKSQLGGYISGNQGISASRAVKLGEGDALAAEVKVAPSTFARYFALSAYLKKDSATPASTSINVYVNNAVFPLVSSLELVSSSIAVGDFNSLVLNDDSWNRYIFVYKLAPVEPVNNEGVVNLLAFIAAIDKNIMVDNVMLEEIDSPMIASAHEYSDYASQNAVYIKKAPKYLNCYDVNTLNNKYGVPMNEAGIDKTNDAKSANNQKGCDKFSQICTAEEVGCEAYDPTDGGMRLNGVVSFADYCPQECAGYAAFSQSKTYFENNEFPVYAIPSTAQQCSASEAGCDEFTNLDKLSSGGEAREYYSELKHCARLPDSQGSCAAYYTWEGTAVSGYQLEKHFLQKEISANAPKAVASSIICDEATFNAKTNPDCRQYYDESGAVYYRLMSKVVTCSENCKPYRRTIKYGGQNGGKDECEKLSINGKWQDNECIFMAIPEEGKMCSPQNAGCREYRGNQAGVIYEVENYTFSGGSYQGLEVTPSEQNTSPEFGQYLTVKPDTSTIPTAKLNTSLDELGFTSGEYQVSFWLKNNASGDSSFWVDAGELNNKDNKSWLTGMSNENFSDEWKFFTYNFVVDPSDVDIFQLGIGAYGAFDIDNLKISKTQDIKYLIKNSWNIPLTCDYPLNAELDATNKLPQAQIGCREYKDREGATHYLKSVSNLCRDDRVGCEALIDTQNSVYPFAGLYKEGSDVWGLTYLFGDSLTYLVVDEKNECAASEKGCAALGLPDLAMASDGTETVKTAKDGANAGKEIWNNLFYKLDPDTYGIVGSPLCVVEEVGCEEYADEAGAKYYFKKPGDKLCEYRKVQEGNKFVYGWYKKKTDTITSDEKCDYEQYYSNGVKHLVKNSDDDDTFGGVKYSGWAGVCPAVQDKCAAFVDPTDTSKSGNGKPYYYINNESIDRSSCTGASRKEGCLLFNDTSKLGVEYAANATYAESDSKAGDLVSPKKSVKYNDLTVDSKNCKDYPLCQEYYDCLVEKGLNGGCAVPTVASCIDSNQTNLNHATCAEEFYKQQANANTTIKVIRDRECAQWYACESGHWVWNQDKGKYEEQCDQVGLCDELDVNLETPECVHFVEGENENNLLSQNEKLNETYENRGTQWFDFEYTGYVIPGANPIQFYNAVDVANKMTCNGTKTGDECSSDSSVCGAGVKCKKLKTCGGTQDGAECSNDASECDGDEPCAEIKDYRLVKYVVGANKKVKTCDTNTDCEESGKIRRCVSGKCVEPLSGTFENSPEPACRAYPRKDSPFPTAAQEAGANSASTAFENATMMYTKEGDTKHKPEDFACAYRKVSYGKNAITKYQPLSTKYTPSMPDGFCQNFPEKKCECNEPIGEDDIKTATMCSSDTCKTEGSTDEELGLCMRRDSEKITNYFGWQGYCLERDLSLNANNNPDDNPCLTWYPADSLAGLMDTKNNYDDAGFNVAGYGYTNGWMYYCVESSRWEKRTPFIERESGTVDCDGGEENKGLSGYDVDYLDEDAGSDWPLGTGYCDKSNFGYNVKKIAQCAIWGPCWESDADCDHLDSISCPENYDIGDITYFERTSGGNCGWDYEDKAAFDYWCNPINFDAADKGSQTNIEPKSLSWFKDDSYKLDGKAIKTDYGSTGSEYGNQKPPYNDEYKLNEDERQGCDAFYAISQDSSGDNRAYTNRIYQYAKSSADVCPNAAQAVGNTNYKIDKTTKCSPLGALAINQGKTAVETELENAFLYNAKNEDDESLWSCDKSSSEYPSGGAHCFTYPGSQSFNIDSLFAKSYGYFKQTFGATGSSGYCESNFAGVNNQSCKSDNECKNIQYTEYCYAFTAGKCANNSPDKDKKGKDCLTDIDCGAPNTMEGKSSDGEKTRKYCIEKAPQPVGNCPAGTSKVEITNTENSTKTVSACVAGLWKKDSAVCSLNLNSSGKPETKTSNDNMATCQFINYPSNSGYVKYANQSSSCKGTKIEVCKGYKYGTKNGTEACFINLDGNCSEYIPGKTLSDCIQKGGNFIDDPDGDGVGICYKYEYSNGTACTKGETKSVQTTVDCSWDYTADSGKARPPTVAAVIGTDKTNSKGKPIYAAIPGKITVSTQKGSQTSGDIQAGGGQLKVSVKFYAWADDDQMPLRTVIVNWGDGNMTGNGNIGKYQNHKPRCQGKENEKLGLCAKSKTGANYEPYYGYACAEDSECSEAGAKNCLTTLLNCDYDKDGSKEQCTSDRFGDTSAACIEGYFQYDHVYNCSTTDAEYKQGKDACEYTIGVQVKDNWGWCNGNHIAADTPGGNGSAGFYVDDTIDNCDLGNLSNNNAVEYYDGYIYVKP